MRLHVELVYDPRCPHVEGARDTLTSALRDNGVAAVWTEWRSDEPGIPERARSLGSPTILVNGEDVAPRAHPWALWDEAEEACCRIYQDVDGRPSGVPPMSLVTAAILKALAPDVV